MKNLLALKEMQETWVQSLGQEDPLEEEIPTHSSILAWRIRWKKETGTLQSLGSQRVRHSCSKLTCTHARAYMGHTQDEALQCKQHLRVG